MDDLQESWKYEFEDWDKTFMSKAVRLVDEYDQSESYDMDRGEIFELTHLSILLKHYARPLLSEVNFGIINRFNYEKNS